MPSTQEFKAICYTKWGFENSLKHLLNTFVFGIIIPNGDLRIA